MGPEADWQLMASAKRIADVRTDRTKVLDLTPKPTFPSLPKFSILSGELRICLGNA